jgi:hypothetical protein
MSVDTEFLLGGRRREDPAAGIAEEFLGPALGGGITVAVMARPLGGPKPVGWVVCPSFAMEQIHLGRMEVVIARALAAAGFPVLRYHGQGYGDSQAQGDTSEVGLASHLSDAADAVALMTEQGAVPSVGVLGIRFGALSAALVADEHGLPYMALWEPVVKGAQFMRDFLRSEAYYEMARGTDGAGGSRVEGLRADLETTGWADVKGFALRRTAHDEIAAVDLTADVRRFAGSALVGTITRSGAPGSGPAKLAEHLGSLGGRCTAEAIQDPLPIPLGQYHYSDEGSGKVKADTQFALARSVAEATVRWAVAETASTANADGEGPGEG